MTAAADFFRTLAETARLGWADRRNFLDLTASHLNLVLLATAVAVAIGLPLGILASRSARMERVTLTVANVFQTIPGLAMLGLLLIVLGRIGALPALVALVLYALLPIVKNTVLGLKGIDPGVLEAARGMGMTAGQRLRLVELPLAVPVLMGGIRVATVASFGLATIATAVGARGLGNYIFRGMQTLDTRYVLLGSAAAAALALAFDATLGTLERRLDPSRSGGLRSRLGSTVAWGTLLALATLAFFGGWISGVRSSDRSKTVVVGSKNFSEAILLGHMLAQLIEDQTDLTVDRRFNLDGFACFQGLLSGDLDVYVEYSGTALTALLKEKPRNDPAEVRRLVATAMARRGITTLEPLGFENTFAILVRRETAAERDLSRISDLAVRGRSLIGGFGTEFMSRSDGYPGLVAAYGLAFDKPPVEMDLNLLYQSLASGAVDLAAGNSTDGRIDALDLVTLEDDRRYFPPYEAIPLARAAALAEHPESRSAIERLEGRLDAPTMRRLNHQVDGLRRDPAEVAREFLRGAGLLSP